MKQQIQGAVLGCILTVLLMGTVTAIANDGIRNISVTFRSIRLIINGQLVIPRDAAGNVIEPFIWNGTVYLPLQTIGDALNMDVRWDGNTSTVYLDDEPARDVVRGHSWLDHMQQLNLQRGDIRHTMAAWRAGDGSFDRGLRFSIRNIASDQNSWQSVDIPLNANYNIFAGKMVHSGILAHQKPVQIRIYGDGRLLYASPTISPGTIPIPFSIDVTNVLMLQIYVEASGRSISNTSYTVTGIVDAYFTTN